MSGNLSRISVEKFPVFICQEEKQYLLNDLAILENTSQISSTNTISNEPTEKPKGSVTSQ